MKIRALLLAEKKVLDQAIIELGLPSPAEAVKLKEEMSRAYIELDTGGMLNGRPEKSKEILGEIIGMRLAQFANYVISAIEFDSAIIQKGECGTPGYDAIEESLLFLSKKLRKINSPDNARA